MEVDLCGHATLASAFTYFDMEASLTQGELYEIDIPS